MAAQILAQVAAQSRTNPQRTRMPASNSDSEWSETNSAAGGNASELSKPQLIEEIKRLRKMNMVLQDDVSELNDELVFFKDRCRYEKEKKRAYRTRYRTLRDHYMLVKDAQIKQEETPGELLLTRNVNSTNPAAEILEAMEVDAAAQPHSPPSVETTRRKYQKQPKTTEASAEIDSDDERTASKSRTTESQARKKRPKASDSEDEASEDEEEEDLYPKPKKNSRVKTFQAETSSSSEDDANRKEKENTGSGNNSLSELRRIVKAFPLYDQRPRKWQETPCPENAQFSEASLIKHLNVMAPLSDGTSWSSTTNQIFVFDTRGVVWSGNRSKQHALKLFPKTQQCMNGQLHLKSPFDDCHGQQRTCFLKNKTSLFYHGIYKIHCIPQRVTTQVYGALNAVSGFCFAHQQQTRKLSLKVIRDLCKRGTIKFEWVAFQLVGFDEALYNQLIEEDVSAPKRKHLTSQGSSRKRPRLDSNADDSEGADEDVDMEEVQEEGTSEDEENGSNSKTGDSRSESSSDSDDDDSDSD